MADVMNRTKLIALAELAKNNAHAPYSNFKVGAAILADNGQNYIGCNVENAAYPEGQCAEAGAISAMVVAGCNLISEIVIVGSDDILITPCGGCRQKLSEFCDENTKILLVSLGKIKVELTLEDLLPYSFGSKNLGV